MNLGKDLAPCLSAGVLILALSACGGGGPDATIGGVTPPPAPTADSTLLPFVTAAGELKLLDPAAPASPALVLDTGLDAPYVPAPTFSIGPYLRIAAGVYDGAADRISDFHYRVLVYIKQGQLFRASLLKGTSLAPVRVSALANVCGFRGLATDYAMHLNSVLQVETAGVDNDCRFNSDNELRALRLNATSIESGVLLSYMVSLGSLLNADGSLRGHLVQDGSFNAPVLRRYDANFLNPVDLANLVSGTSVSSAPRINRQQTYLSLRRSSEASPRLFRYDAGTDALHAVHTFTGVPGLQFALSATDATHVYFADAPSIYRVAHGGSSSQLLFTAPAGMELFGLSLSVNRIVVETANPNTGNLGLGSLSKSGAASLTVLEPEREDLHFETSAGTRVYYDVGTGAGTREAVSVGEADTGETRYPGAAWSGLIFSTDGLNFGRSTGVALSKLLLAQGDGLGNLTVRSVDAPTATLGLNLGQIANARYGYVFGAGRYQLANVQIARSSSAADNDVYFVDLQSAGSLRGVAQTVGADDAVAQ